MLTAALPQIQSALQTIGGCIMAIIGGIGSILHAIISAIVSFGIVLSCLTCGYCGRRRARTTRSRV